MPPCRWLCLPLNWESRITAIESSYWPTPTAKANHFSPSMRRWPKYARMQADLGQPTSIARFFLVMMGFPEGWLDSLATRYTSSPPR